LFIVKKIVKNGSACTFYDLETLNSDCNVIMLYVLFLYNCKLFVVVHV